MWAHFWFSSKKVQITNESVILLDTFQRLFVTTDFAFGVENKQKTKKHSRRLRYSSLSVVETNICSSLSY